MVTTFSKAGLCFPDQYLKLKSSSVSQPSLLLYDFVTQTCAAAGSSHTVGSEVSHSADKIAQKQSRDCTFWLNKSLIILMTSLRKQFYPNYHQGFCSSKAPWLNEVPDMVLAALQQSQYLSQIWSFSYQVGPFLPKRHSRLTQNHKKTLLEPLLQQPLQWAGVRRRHLSQGQGAGAPGPATPTHVS